MRDIDVAKSLQGGALSENVRHGVVCVGGGVASRNLRVEESSPILRGKERLSIRGHSCTLPSISKKVPLTSGALKLPKIA